MRQLSLQVTRPSVGRRMDEQTTATYTHQRTDNYYRQRLKGRQLLTDRQLRRWYGAGCQYSVPHTWVHSRCGVACRAVACDQEQDGGDEAWEEGLAMRGPRVDVHHQRLLRRHCLPALRVDESLETFLQGLPVGLRVRGHPSARECCLILWWWECEAGGHARSESGHSGGWGLDAIHLQLSCCA